MQRYGSIRRELLRAGALGCFGLSLPQFLAAAPVAHPADRTFGRAKRCILLFLTGGPPQHETWDLKPDAPANIRGEFRPIATSVPGLLVGELFPQLALRADRLCIVRSITHIDNTHTSAGYTMLTGVPHPHANEPTAANIRPTPDDHPHIGSLLAKVRPAGAVPAFAALPEIIKDAAVNEFPGLGGGFLGTRYSPFLIEADAERTGFRLPEIVLSGGLSPARLADRETLLQSLDRGLDRIERLPVREMDTWYQRALVLLGSEPVRKAFDLEQEAPPTRDRYGRHLFGQGCLLARRLVEAGVGLVTVYWHYEGPDDSPVWDTHQNNFAHLRERLMPPTDAAFSALLDDLALRGLLDDTLVVCMGEFGRSPLVNRFAGRDHWAGAQSIALAGAGIAAGTVYGATDKQGALPSNDPVSPADLTATLMHLLGIPPDLEIRDRAGRPVRACQGAVVRGVLA